MKPNLSAMVWRTTENFVVILCAGMFFHWITADTFDTEPIAVLSTGAAFVLYAVARFRFEHYARIDGEVRPKDVPENRIDKPPTQDGTAWIPTLLVVPLLAIAATVALQCLRPESTAFQYSPAAKAALARIP